MMARTLIAMAKLLDMPHITKHIMVLSRPTRMTGFRPKRSDARPQGTAVMLCDMEKTAPVKPAHRATSSLGTPKLRIISGR